MGFFCYSRWAKIFASCSLLVALSSLPASAQTLYVLNAGDSSISSISKVSPTGVVSNIALSDAANHTGGFSLAIDTSGNFYVSYLSDNTIGKYDSNGNVLAFNLTGESLNTPTGLAFDKAGNLYTANLGNNSISKITTTGVVSTFAAGDQLADPWQIAFDASGNLYSASLDGPSISKFDSLGNSLSFPTLRGGGLGFGNPLTGIVFDSQGNLLASNGNLSTIVKIDQNTGDATLFATNANPLEPLVGLAIDPLDNLYAVEFNINSLSKFNSIGNPIPFNLSGGSLNVPNAVVFAPRQTSAAPEPASGTLIALIGLPIAGVVARRKASRF